MAQQGRTNNENKPREQIRRTKRENNEENQKHENEQGAQTRRTKRENNQGEQNIERTRTKRGNKT